MVLAAKPYLQQVSLQSKSIIDSNAYPYNISAIAQLGTLKFHSDITFFVGENGAGKSTLLEAIAVNMGFSAEGGTKNARFSTMSEYSAESVYPIYESLKINKSFKMPRDGFFLRAESFFNVATYMESIGSPDAVYHQQSHGEAFLTLLTEKFRGKGLYLLDEPEAALSPMRQLAALSAIHQLVQDESQFIIATHWPILLAYPSAKIVSFDADGLREISYEETEHFTVTRDFLNNHQRRLAQLLTDD
ncbi:MAG: AAA family ATPase [Bdellovibrio sp.]|nr:AAA family ATPase [Methylotenera sp.]